jgi:hypothetical protein
MILTERNVTGAYRQRTARYRCHCGRLVFAWELSIQLADKVLPRGHQRFVPAFATVALPACAAAGNFFSVKDQFSWTC